MKVLVIRTFIDKNTGKTHIKGSYIEITEKRVRELKGFVEKSEPENSNVRNGED